MTLKYLAIQLSLYLHACKWRIGPGEEAREVRSQETRGAICMVVEISLMRLMAGVGVEIKKSRNKNEVGSNEQETRRQYPWDGGRKTPMAWASVKLTKGKRNGIKTIMGNKEGTNITSLSGEYRVWEMCPLRCHKTGKCSDDTQVLVKAGTWRDYLKKNVFF